MQGVAQYESGASKGGSKLERWEVARGGGYEGRIRQIQAVGKAARAGGR